MEWADESYFASASRMRASAEPYTWSGRRSIATRLSASAIRSYSSQSALRRRVVALKMCRRASAYAVRSGPEVAAMAARAVLT
jgi:hypothetical protein